MQNSAPPLSLRDQPVSWVLARLRGLVGVEPIPGTRIFGLLVAVALTSLPLGLLNYFNSAAIADPAPLFEIALVASLVALISAAALGRFLAPHVAGVMVGALGYGFFSLSWLESSSTVGLVLIWVFSSLVGALVIVWLIGNARWAVAAAAISTTGIAATLFGLSLLNADEPADIAQRVVPETLAFSEVPGERPNVYLFVLDGFARPDITVEQFSEHDVDFDISESIGALERLGFVQDLDGTANYPQTILSVPSTLNAEYHHVPEQPLAGGEIWLEGRAALTGNNTLVNSLRAAGYEYWHSSSVLWAASACDVEIADRCLGNPGTDIETRDAIWSETPLRNVQGIDLDTVTDPTTVVRDILASREANPTDDPYFVFSHLISPHHPYRFNDDCSRRGDSAEGMSFTEGGEPQFRPLYAGAAACAASQLESAMTDLLEADPTAIIFLQADHGSPFETDPENNPWDDKMVRERMAIFRMTFMPDECRSSDPAAQSLINTAPLIVSCISGEEPQLIESRILLSDFVTANVRDAEVPLIESR